MQPDSRPAQADRSVLVFTMEFPPHLGGAATYAYNLAVGLAGIGCNVTVLTISRQNEIDKQSRIDRQLREANGIIVKRIRFIPKVYLAIMARGLRRLLRQHEFSALIFADSGAQKSGAYFLETPGLPSWTVFHGSEADNYFGSSTLPLRLTGAPRRMRRFFNELTGCIAVSDWIRSEILALLPELADRCTVVHHGVAVDDLSLSVSRDEAKSALGIDAGKQVIFSASRLIAEKGQDVLLRAFSLASRNAPHMQLVIAGDGPARQSLEALAHSEGVADRVTFTGRLGSDDMNTGYRACDVFAQPSRYPFDSFGLVYLEANACGRTVIAGNVAGIPESVEDGVSGFLVDPLDSDRIAELLLEIVTDGELRSRLETSALERVRREFSLEAMARKTASLVLSNP